MEFLPYVVVNLGRVRVRFKFGFESVDLTTPRARILLEAEPRGVASYPLW